MQGKRYFRGEGGDEGVGLVVLMVGDAFCWDEVWSKTSLACGIFGHPHRERGKPSWIAPSLLLLWAGKRGTGPFELFSHPLFPPLVIEFIINLINMVYMASINLWAIALKDILLKDYTISTFGTRMC